MQNRILHPEQRKKKLLGVQSVDRKDITQVLATQAENKNKKYNKKCKTRIKTPVAEII